MPQQKKKELAEWVSFLSTVEIPVLKQTARNLAELLEDEKNLSARNMAHIIKNDPMMTVKLLRYLQLNKHSRQEHEVAEVEQALMMLGLESALNKVPTNPLVEEILAPDHMDALISLLRVTRRANIAADYAFDWSVRLNDLHFEEIRIATLLHDIAEILMWCFAPAEMTKIKALQKQNKALRSHMVQKHIFGFSLPELQSALIEQWSLPKLLITLMDDACVEQVRVRNVTLAINLARHAANGWDDAALSDDYKEIGQLLKLEDEEVIIIVGAEQAKKIEEEAIAHEQIESTNKNECV